MIPFREMLHRQLKLVKHSQLRVAVVVVAVCTVAWLVLFNNEARLRHKFMQDSFDAMSWEGFGPEKGTYNFTLVTAMLDIGRGQWTLPGTRSYNTYLLHMQRVLRLDVNLVVFTDAQALPFILWMRRGREDHTLIVQLDLKDLPYYSYRDKIQDIMNSEQYQQDNELIQRNKCEAFIPEYDIIQWSKLYFLNESVFKNPFHDDFFIWLDGGYGHGDDIHPAGGIWNPKNLFEYSDKVTFLEREPVEKYRQYSDRLHKMSVNIVAGGFIAGGSKVLQKLYQLQQQLIADWLTLGIVDDDQTVYMHIYFKHPHLFRLVPADWDDVFKLFHAP